MAGGQRSPQGTRLVRERESWQRPIQCSGPCGERAIVRLGGSRCVLRALWRPQGFTLENVKMETITAIPYDILKASATSMCPRLLPARLLCPVLDFALH